MTNWIKCSDRMPEKDGRYLVTEIYPSGMKCVEVGNLINGNWVFSFPIVSWQELPEPAEVDNE